MALVAGLTGGIASGKSTVANMLKEMGLTVIDADAEARAAVKRGERAHQEIVDYFGADILAADLEINRSKLGEIIFNDEEKRLVLNRIVHPAVRERMALKRETALENGEQLIVMDIPLLLESKLTSIVDKVLLVYTDPDVQLARLMNRNSFSEQEALARINAQMPLKEKVKLADAVINNNGTIEETRKQLMQILKSWGFKK
ncbi:dephospho-CoA kinase [Bacillus canaveralius]|uniref:Dephospho-CoA kinase n=1 Tax=Bacillus canaveralius TaxID=1403243 RepID=A0A2N5GJP2_9BACI|nr:MULTISPECIES: dephospho-CoA kinase [Bacillus]PLR81495.1 dephospho-CoA kinase [Bacillus canaveralius]PLR82354.1 dephospho-CoA kinase [Bacillus sp. V33-4]PLR93879.1 dephospho-CoA kinase [Bacillus canaveralius]RSK52539.1 dephospho-CoA kinase [Bacillus canaveralius]